MAYCLFLNITLIFVMVPGSLFVLSSVCVGEGPEISHLFSISSCEDNKQTFVCQEKNFVEYSEEIVLELSKESIQSKNDTLYNYIYK